MPQKDLAVLLARRGSGLFPQTSGICANAGCARTGGAERTIGSHENAPKTRTMVAGRLWRAPTWVFKAPIWTKVGAAEALHRDVRIPKAVDIGLFATSRVVGITLPPNPNPERASAG